MTEVWKPVKDFEGLYEVSTLGRVKSLTRRVYRSDGRLLQTKAERILKQNTQRYSFVVLCKDGKTFPKFVHRLVAEAFIPNPEDKPVVDHIDTNSTNNEVTNLRWATISENCLNPLTREHNSKSKQGHPGYLKKHSEEAKQKMRKPHKRKEVAA